MWRRKRGRERKVMIWNLVYTHTCQVELSNNWSTTTSATTTTTNNNNNNFTVFQIAFGRLMLFLLFCLVELQVLWNRIEVFIETTIMNECIKWNQFILNHLINNQTKKDLFITIHDKFWQVIIMISVVISYH